MVDVKALTTTDGLFAETPPPTYTGPVEYIAPKLWCGPHYGPYYGSCSKCNEEKIIELLGALVGP